MNLREVKRRLPKVFLVCFIEAVQKAFKALENCTIETLTPNQLKALYSVLNGDVTFVISSRVKRGRANQAAESYQVRFTS